MADSHRGKVARVVGAHRNLLRLRLAEDGLGHLS